MQSLVIIDMQPEFEAASKRSIRKPILREIDLAKCNSRPIVVVEFVGCGKTHYFIRSALRNYPHKYLVKKYEDDGSVEVSELLERITNSKRVKICGVNTGLCVYSTAAGLKYKGYSITSVADACYAHNKSDHRVGLKKLQKFSKVIRNVAR